MNVTLPKYLQISIEIETRIKNGNWENGKIPSVREIAAAHHVSVVTASRALQVLRDKGIINAVERSGCFLVNRGATTEEIWALVMHTTPGPWSKATGTITTGGFEQVAKQQGITLKEDLIDFQKKMTDREMARHVRTAKEEGVNGIFFMPSRLNEDMMRQDEQFLHACDVADLPVILIERNLRGANRPLKRDIVCSDDVDGGRQCTRHLLEKGRRKIVFVTGSPTSSHLDRMAGYYQVMSEAHVNGASELPHVIWQNPGISSKKAYSILADQIVSLKADGVICYQDYTAIGLILELLSRGLSVPKDVAIVGFDDLPIGNMFAIGVTTYAFPSEEVARQAIWLMRERRKIGVPQPVRLVVPGNLIVRDSSVSTS